MPMTHAPETGASF